MRAIKSRDRKVFGEIQDFFRELKKSADLGVSMHSEWEGCRRAHVCNDRFRVIWRDLAQVEDYAGAPGDAVVAVEVLRVGPKVLPGGGTIYQQPNPAAG